MWQDEWRRVSTARRGRGRGPRDAIRGEKTLAELSELHDVHANQIVDWKNQLLERAASVFGAESATAPWNTALSVSAQLLKPLCRRPATMLV